jgi:SIR2-like domain
MSVVALVGNGLSIAYNPELSVPSLTLELLRRFQDADNELRAIAAEVAAGHSPGFEALLGPFDAVSAMIRNLPGLRSGEGWAPRFDSLGAALEAAREIHSHGTGLALDLIAERSQIDGDFQPIDGFCSAIAELDDPANLTIATLNYDGLLTAGFLQEGVHPDWTVHRVLATSDMGDGRTEEEISPDFAVGHFLRTWHLRRVPDFMEERARLLNLHGSLGWLRNTNDPDEVRRFRIPDLREWGFWAKHSRGETVWEPVVVLTSRKTELTEEWPFVLCYSVMRQALAHADRWLVAGYSFADDPVNRAFKSAVRTRQRRGQSSRVLIVGRDRTQLIRVLTRVRLGIPDDWIQVAGDGFPEGLDSDEWLHWAG